MSKYAELLGLLQEDIEKIVEKRMEERVADVITVLMPSVLEHVANSIQILSSPANTGNYDPTLKDLQFTMQTQPGHTRYIGIPFTVIDKYANDIKWRKLDDAFGHLKQRISILEKLNT